MFVEYETSPAMGSLYHSRKLISRTQWGTLFWGGGATSGAASSEVVPIPASIATVARLPRARCHLAVDSAVAASAGTPAAAFGPVSFRLCRTRAVSFAPDFRAGCSARFFTSRYVASVHRHSGDCRIFFLEQRMLLVGT